MIKSADVELISAEIIQFPRRAAAAPPLAADRLSVAVTGLAAALAEQQEAVKRWRAAIDDLTACMRGLRSGLDQFRPQTPQAS